MIKEIWMQRLSIILWRKSGVLLLFCLHKFCCSFNDIPLKVTTDISALKWLNSKGLSARMACWSLKLAQYNVGIEHGTGKVYAVSVALSRNPNECRKYVKKVKIYLCFGIIGVATIVADDYSGQKEILNFVCIDIRRIHMWLVH